MTEPLFTDCKEILFEKLKGYFDPKGVQDDSIFFTEKIQNELGFQRIYFSDDRAFLHFNCEKTSLARELYARLSVESTEKLLKRGWSVKTEFWIRGTGRSPVWPQKKSPRQLAHTQLEREQKESGQYQGALPPATKNFIDFWVSACREGLIRNYSHDREFTLLIDKIKHEGIIDDADYDDLQAVIAEGKANGSTYRNGLNPVPFFGLKFPVPALESSQDSKTAAELMREEIRFLFDALGLPDEYEERQMSAPAKPHRESSALAVTCKQVLTDYKQQIILQGPPGTGKTRLAKDVAELLLRGRVSTVDEQADFLNTCAEFKIVQFHPSYTYEDFIRGIEIKMNGGDTAQYVAVDRILARFADAASKSPEKKIHVLVIDEINRANLSAVLGELIYALEYRGRAVDSMYAVKKKDDSDIETENRQLILPKNLYIIGTMNTADRSAGNLDYAIRRRFAFIDVLPESLLDKGFDDELFSKVRSLFSIDDKYRERSNHLAEEFRPRDVALGHSYFIGLKEDKDRRKFTIEYEIKPILLEYVKDGVLKESACEIIGELT